VGDGDACGIDDRLVRMTVEGYGGYVSATIGDGFAWRFARASD
jgi:hypothetical protein